MAVGPPRPTMSHRRETRVVLHLEGDLPTDFHGSTVSKIRLGPGFRQLRSVASE